ncbi:O-antigen ligase family protein [Bradyrhizobium iriomotense]|uniref:O-antigen ligase family protein n=1 Tax=Bradyrhizobium iriomotense TaxID=441950 RepID=UPI001B8A607F|nr:O-antigen ligase family protein [Bradyrhizobium iriomotense]MBR1133256.1 O-antigen ligase family protein [Bradyrhizobium iriomotense]
MTEAARTTLGGSKHSPLTPWLKPQSWIFYADLLAVLTAAMLPWSTTGFYILLGFWFVVQVPLVPTRDVPTFLHLLSRPICLWPLAIFLTAVLGTLWADVPWQARLLGIKPVAKLLAIPFLLYHFQHSRRGAWVFIAFLASCALLMGLSWIVLFVPPLKLATTASAGVPVKNYIDQSQEFALCMVAIAPCIAILYKRHRYAAAVACGILALGFLANMAFVVSARSALIYVPVLLIVFALKYLEHRQSMLLFAAIAITAVAIWFTSPNLRSRVKDISIEFQFYEQNIPIEEAHKQNLPFSTGLRLEYWRKSLSFFASAPFFGNGTGSIEGLFERDAIGKTGLAIEVTRNPHNQTLNVAVQWGMIGIIALYAMWLSHLFLFRGDGFANWVGLLVVVQNLASSLVNSHLFDFHEGWIYVLGVGIAGGMSLGAKQRAGELPA